MGLRYAFTVDLSLGKTMAWTLKKRSYAMHVVIKPNESLVKRSNDLGDLAKAINDYTTR